MIFVQHISKIAPDPIQCKSAVGNQRIFYALMIMNSVKIALVFSLVSAASNFENNGVINKNGQEKCWQKLENCTVNVEVSLSSGRSFHYDVDCFKMNETHETIFLRQLNGSGYVPKDNNDREIVEGVWLDGCNANLHYIHPEHLMSYLNVNEVSFKNFHLSEITSTVLNGVHNSKIVRFKNNHFERMLENAFTNCNRIEEVCFEGNDLKSIDTKLFHKVWTLKTLSLIENELVIKDDKVFFNTNIETLVIAIKTLDSKLLLNLPKSLMNLNVTKTSFIEDSAAVVNSSKIEEIQITYTNIANISIMENRNLHFLNLSSNALKFITLRCCAKLIILDLSHNLLQAIGDENFVGLENLIELHLEGNQLKTFSLGVLSRGPTNNNLHFVDLSNNLLQEIEVPDKFDPPLTLKVQINQNPWNCRWLLDISEKHIQLLQILTFDKKFERINVNGAECISYPFKPSHLVTSTKGPSTWNATASYYHPPESKKIQRTEALIVVLFLFIGVGFLSFLLYLWIKCQKMFHLSFYRSIPRKRCHKNDIDAVRPELNVVTNNEEAKPQEIYQENHECPFHSKRKAGTKCNNESK